jgi:hypothetical protein
MSMPSTLGDGPFVPQQQAEAGPVLHLWNRGLALAQSALTY